MNKFYLLTFFCFIFLFSTTALACDFCYVKNINCPSIVQVKQEFNITFDFSGTGPNYPYDYISLWRSDERIGCLAVDVQACQWQTKSILTTAPSTIGTYTYAVKCYAGDSKSEEYC